MGKFNVKPGKSGEKNVKPTLIYYKEFISKNLVHFFPFIVDPLIRFEYFCGREFS